MSDLIRTLQSFPPQRKKLSVVEYDQEIRAYRSTLKKVPTKNLVDDAAGPKSLLNILDPAEQSLGFLLILTAHYQAWKVTHTSNIPDSFLPGGETWAKAVKFLEVFDPIQVRYAGHEFSKIIEIVAKAAESVSRPIFAVQPLKVALLRLDPTCSTLTAAHTVFMSICLKARTCRSALPILEKTVFHIPTAADRAYLQRSEIYLSDKSQPSVAYITEASGLSGNITYQTYLEYFLYGAMIYMSRKEWKDALRFLHIVIAAPANNSVSNIMVEGYKKWVIVSLLAKGQVSRVPQTVSVHTSRTYKSLAKPYDILAEVFKAGTLDRLKAEINAGHKIWSDDNNLGLVLQTVEAYRQFSILKLEKTFATLSIPEISSRFSSDNDADWDPEKFVAELIAAGNLEARLVQSSRPSDGTILRFGQSDKNLNSSSEARLWADLMKEKSRVKLMLDNVSSMDVRLELGREYIESVRKSQSRKDQRGKEGNKAVAFDDDDGVDLDEDLMVH